ncbi:MAG: alpha/beta hydrolase [Thermoleophilia bacterium]
MQRVTFTNSRNLTLVGNLYPSTAKSIVILSHGFTSDKSSRGRHELLAGSLVRSGFSALAFDFSGSGESDDDLLTIENQVDDLSSAIEYVASEGYTNIALQGHSLGGLISLMSYSPRIITMVLTGPVTGPVNYLWEEYYPRDRLEQLRKNGRLEVEVQSQWRQRVTVGSLLLETFATIDQERLLTGVKCPLLIIHGNSKEDEEERMLLATTRRGIKYLPEGSRLDVIEEAGHSFTGHMDEVVDKTVDWYTNHLPDGGSHERE